MANLKQDGIPGGQKEISPPVSDMLEAGVLVPMNSLHNTPEWPLKKADGSWGLTVDY